MVGSNGRQGGEGRPLRQCRQCSRWKPVAAFVGERGRDCVRCDVCRAYDREWYRARRGQEGGPGGQAGEGWEPGWEECLRCEVRPDCDESDPRCGRRGVLEGMRAPQGQAGEIEARAPVVPPGYVSLPELAAELGVVRQSLYGRIERGTLTAERWRIGNRMQWLVPREAP